MTIHDLVQKALTANRESKHIEFKESFDPDSTRDCCELAKDFVALANTGGGILVIGLDSFGAVVGSDLSKLFKLDPADVTNKLSKYVGGRELSFTIESIEKKNTALVAFLIDAASLPLVFEKPGTYPDPEMKSGQKTVFGQGTVFFRHGAKSEPGTNLDIEKSLERRLDSIRKHWTSGFRKVVAAPLGSQVQIISTKVSTEPTGQLSNVRAVSDQSAQTIHITRDPSIPTTGSFLHESISKAIFDEINNVIETNRLLAEGRDEFLLDNQLYFRIYAERHNVKQPEKEITQLFYTGIVEYCPMLFWCSLLTDQVIAEHLAELVLWPRGNAQTILRMTPLLGINFYKWLSKKFETKWGKNTQRPQSYWALQKLESRIRSEEPSLIASRLGLASSIPFSKDPNKMLSDIFADQGLLNGILSQACMEVFAGKKEYRGVARDFDYLVNSEILVARGQSVSAIIKEIVGNRLPNEESIETPDVV